MAVIAIKEYEFPSSDAVERFHGAQVLYVGWEDHLIFCSPLAFPLPPSMHFGDLVAGPLKAGFSYHPDFAQIDWAKAEWFKSGKPVTLDFDKSLAENGLKHKDVIRFRTPGLNGIKGSCN